MNNRNKEWTKEEDGKFIELVNTNKYSYHDIAKILGRTYGGCHGRAHKLGIKNPFVPRKYKLNQSFWNSPNLLNSYWAGFSAADSSIQKLSDNNYRYVLSLATKDINHLYQLKKDCEYGGPIITKERIGNFDKSYNKIYSSSTLGISCPQWGRDLESNFNIMSNKVYRLGPPPFKDIYLLYSWLIGYLDGDGTIFYDHKYKRMLIGFGSCSETIIKWVREFINTNFNQKLSNKKDKIYQKEGEKCHLFNVFGIRACIIVDYLRQFPVPKLARKWENPEVLKYIDEKKKEYPHLFKILNPSELAPYLSK